MTMLDAQRRITQKALFSVKRLGEEIEYTDSKNVTKTIVAIIMLGTEMSRSDWNDSATQVEHGSINDIAEFNILRADVPKPNEGDHIKYMGETWKVVQVYNYDSAGDNYVLICSNNGRGWKNSKGWGL